MGQVFLPDGGFCLLSVAENVAFFILLFSALNINRFYVEISLEEQTMVGTL